MTFKIQVQMDTSEVAPKAKGVTDDLGKMGTSAQSTTDALGKMGTVGADAAAKIAQGTQQAAAAAAALGDAATAAAGATTGLGDSMGGSAALTGRQIAMLESLRAPMREYQADIAAISGLYQAGKVSEQEYTDQLIRMQKAVGDTTLMTSEWAKAQGDEARVLGQIRAPLQQYEQDVAALASLMAKGQITAAEYEAQLAKVTTRYQSSAGPAQGPQQNNEHEAALAREIQLLAQIEAPSRQYQANVSALNALLDRAAISTNQYDAELAKLDAKFGTSKATALSPELQREVDLLERLRKPMLDYEQNLATINSLLAKGTISQSEYDRELERAQKAAGAGLGPVQGPKQQTAADLGATSRSGGQINPLADALTAIAPQLGAAGQLLSGLASSGVIAAGAVVGLGIELVHLGDSYTTLENQIDKFTQAGDGANEILHQQLDLSHEIHADLSTTVQLYSRVREGTDELNLSRRRQIELTREIGDAVVASGKSVESAEALTRQLSFAFASGAFRGRELLMIMRQFPDIANAFTASTGKSRLELLQLANKGEFTASMILKSFDTIGPEMSRRVDHMRETTSQTWQHFKDWLTVQSGSTTDLVASQMLAQIDAADHGMTVAQAQLQKRLKEMQRQISVEQERTAKVSEIDEAARSRGISIGPFDKSAAASLDKARITARAAGIEMADAFEGAKDKARLYGAEIDKLKDSDAAKRIADAAKRIYDAMAGADEIVYKNTQHWTEVSDRIDTATKAIEKYNAAGQAGAREVVELQRQISQDQIALRLKDYGGAVTGMVQGKDKAKGDLEDLTKAAKDGVLAGDALRQSIDRDLTALNDGRLPYAIKTWESLVLPLRDASEAVAGMSVNFEAGRLGVMRYVEEMQKLQPALTKLQEADELQARMPQYLKDRASSLRGLGERRGVIAVIDVTDQAKAAIEAQYKLLAEAEQAANEAKEIAAGRSFNVGRASGTLGADNQAVLSQLQDEANRTLTQHGDNYDALNNRLERARQLGNQFEAPAVQYEHALKDIEAATDSWALSEEHASFLRRRARTEYNDQLEALSRMKGPMEQYEAAIRKLNDQLAAGDIGPRAYVKGVDAAKVAMLEATGAAQTFKGAMEIEWIKLQQQAEAFGATIANVLVSDVDKLNDAIVTAANGGAVSWTAMVDSMIEDLEKLILKQLEVQAVSALFGASGGLASAIGGAAAGSAASDIGAVAVESAGSYRTGGEFMVGGNGGTDTTPVAFHATRGEVVSITPPGAYQHPSQATMSRAAQPAPQPPPVINVHNHYDSSVGIAAIQSPGGTTAILNVLRANAGAMRSAMGVKG
jgi:tape measure domain-containing protein